MPSLSAMTRETEKPSKFSVTERSAGRKSASTVFKSTERVADSDLESDTESDPNSDSEEDPKIPAHPVPKVKAQKLAAALPVAKVNDQKSKSPRIGRSNQIQKEKEKDSSPETSSNHEISSNDSDEQQGEDERVSDSEGASGNSGVESVIEEEPERHKTSIASSKISRNSDTAKTQFTRSLPTIDYCPPAGFEKCSLNQEAKNVFSQVFSPSKLEGKQLWYITVPASVPISSVKEVSLQNVQFGKPALSLNGQEYGFVQGHADEKSYTKVMVPDVNSIGYHLERRAIDQTLHLQQILKPHKLAQDASVQDSSSQIPSKVFVPAKKTIRQQPEGLKMRFRPLGFGSGRTGNIGSGPSSSDSTSSINSGSEEPASIPLLAVQHPIGRDREYGDARNPSAGAGKTDPKHSSADSDRSSEASDEDTVDARAKVEESKAFQSTPQRSLKRKLSDVRVESFPNSPLKHPKTSSNILKASKIPQLPKGLKDLPFTEANGTRKLKNGSLASSPILGSSIKIGFVHPSQASDVNTSSSNTLNHSSRITPILPPPRSLFPGSHLHDGFQDTNGKTVVSRSGKGHRTEVGPEESTVESQALHNQAGDPALREKDEKREKRQRQRQKQRQKEVKFLPHGEGSVSRSNILGEAPDQESKGLSLSGNITRSLTTIKPPPKLNLGKFLADEKRPSRAPDTKKAISSSKKTKAHATKSVAPERNDMATVLPKGATSTLSSTLKESVILPPKLKKSVLGRV